MKLLIKFLTFLAQDVEQKLNDLSQKLDRIENRIEKELKTMSDALQNVLAAEAETQKDVQRLADGYVQIKGSVDALNAKIAELEQTIAAGNDAAVAAALEQVKAGVDAIDQIAETAVPEPAPEPPPTA